MIGYIIEAQSRKFKYVNTDDFQQFLRLIGAEIETGPEMRDDHMYIKVNAYSNQARVIGRNYLEDFGFVVTSQEEFEWDEQ